ncbi:hypothetical protein RJ640_029118 [Escallonia rubra]|uniref:Uncharacterized protein n=1 Tax=Escallonia rubra TaxID=112253 RepID=A0AA88RCC5_9ASTE|nr:hypothetical protein RJ640_029118 [Escallonia rubra]
MSPFAVNPNLDIRSFSSLSSHLTVLNPVSTLGSLSTSSLKHNYGCKHQRFYVISSSSDQEPKPNLSPSDNTQPKARSRHQKTKVPENKDEHPGEVFPTTLPKKTRRGRKSEAAAVEDFVRGSLEQTFASIRQQNSELLNDKQAVLREKIGDEVDSDGSGEDNGDEGDISGKKMVVEEDNPDWPLDADVGWGIRASEYFEQHSIKNVVGEDGVEIDWEGEVEDNLVKEINCLEWEAFAFHPSPLIVLVFERYNRATDNWNVLKELEKASMVYWRAKDRLPPRTVKIDINIERDLAYALKVKECPQILFLRGQRILYREKQFRTAEELVQMIAHFYYKAKKPACMSGATVS